MNRIIILLGIPGAGKTTWANKNHPFTVKYGTDDYRVGIDGIYRYDPVENTRQHGDALRDYAFGLENYYNDIVVDNTNVTMDQIAPYIGLGLAYHRTHTVEVVLVECGTDVAAARNTHGVPYDVVAAMQDKLCRLLNEWPSYWPAITMVKGEI